MPSKGKLQKIRRQREREEMAAAWNAALAMLRMAGRDLSGDRWATNR